MRRRLAVLASLALLAAAVLLARRQARRSPAPLAERPRPQRLAGAVPPSLERAEAPTVAPAAPPGEPHFPSVPWTLASPPEERPALTIRCHQSDALVLDRVDVQETPTQVFLTAIAREQARAAGEPPRAPAEATVPLSGPLGTRELIHTPVDVEPDAPPLYP